MATAVIFDLDGLLVDIELISYKIYKEILAEIRDLPSPVPFTFVCSFGTLSGSCINSIRNRIIWTITDKARRYLKE